MKFVEKVMLITGGSSGIGLAVAKLSMGDYMYFNLKKIDSGNFGP